MWVQPNYFWMILEVKLLQCMISEAKSWCFSSKGGGEKTITYVYSWLLYSSIVEMVKKACKILLFAFFQASLKLWNVPMRGQFICSSTLCFTTISKAQHTGATTSTLSTKECASAVERTGATHWATTSGRKGSQKVDNCFWKQEHICLSKVCGNTCYSLQIDHKVWEWA